MGSVTELAHTADVGFEVRAGSPEELFSLAAEGVAAARGAAADRGSAEEAEEIAIERPDPERLLVAWLRELLYRSMRDDLVPSAPLEDVHVEDVRSEEVGDEEVLPPDPSDEPEPPAGGGDGAAGGADGSASRRSGGEVGPASVRARVRWRPAAGPPTREIKGVTYHGLEVRRREDGEWHARVVLDV